MSDPATNPCSTLVDQHIAANRGERSALKYGDSRYSFNDLAALTNRAGNVFRDLGLGVDDPILVLVRPSPAYFAAVLGAMKIGAVPIIEGDDGGLGAGEGFREAKAIVVDESRVGELDSDTKAMILVVGEEAGAHQSFVTLLRAGASSLIAVPRDQNATAIVILGQRGGTKTVSGADLLVPGMLAGHAFANSLEALAAGDSIDIVRDQ